MGSKTEMTNKAAQRASLIALLHIISLHSVLVHSLSISSSSTKNSVSGNNGRNNQQQQRHHQVPQLPNGQAHHLQLSQITTLPPFLTTLSQGVYQNSVVQHSSKLQQQPEGQQHSTGEHRSNSEDDTVPLATINNHSKNNQPMARPPQYVDVSALVGRDRNQNNSGPLTSGSSLGLASGASGLSGKSRSGLPECATQQVCNAIFVRMNYTQKLCECSSNYNWKCSNNIDPQDGHTIELTRKFDKRIYTQIKTCEPLREVRACKSPTDWTLLALQSERTGKAHYVVVCKCPTWAQLEGPYTHNHPPYANIPGIRVYGMLCAHQTARSSAQTYATYNPSLGIYPEFPWTEALNVLNTTNILSTLDPH